MQSCVLRVQSFAGLGLPRVWQVVCWVTNSKYLCASPPNSPREGHASFPGLMDISLQVWPLCGVNDIRPSVMAQCYLGGEVSLKISLCRFLSRTGELWTSPWPRGRADRGLLQHSNGGGPHCWKPQAQTGLHRSDEQLKGSEMALAWKRSWNN